LPTDTDEELEAVVFRAAEALGMARHERIGRGLTVPARFRAVAGGRGTAGPSAGR
jgi:hypothetical protein